MIKIQDIYPTGELRGVIYLLSFSLGTTLVVGLDERDVITWATQYFGSYYGPYECNEADTATVEYMLIQQCLIHNTGGSYKRRVQSSDVVIADPPKPPRGDE